MLFAFSCASMKRESKISKVHRLLELAETSDVSARFAEFSNTQYVLGMATAPKGTSLYTRHTVIFDKASADEETVKRCIDLAERTKPR